MRELTDDEKKFIQKRSRVTSEKKSSKKNFKFVYFLVGFIMMIPFLVWGVFELSFLRVKNLVGDELFTMMYENDLFNQAEIYGLGWVYGFIELYNQRAFIVSFIFIICIMLSMFMLIVKLLLERKK